MFKVFLAVGFEDLEQFLKQSKELVQKFLNTPVEFVGETVYREGIIQGVDYHRPDVIIIREGLNGKQSLIDIIYDIKMNYPDTRIIFLAGDRVAGDALLATLVQFGVYDLVIGSKLDCTEIIRRIIEPKKISDVAHLLPKISVDEKTNTKIFEAPNSNVTPKAEVGIKPIKSISPKVSKEPVSPINKEHLTEEKKPLNLDIKKEENITVKQEVVDTKEEEIVIDNVDDEKDDDILISIDDTIDENEDDIFVIEDESPIEVLKDKKNKNISSKKPFEKPIPFGYKGKKTEKIEHVEEKKEQPNPFININMEKDNVQTETNNTQQIFPSKEIKEPVVIPQPVIPVPPIAQPIIQPVKQPVMPVQKNEPEPKKLDIQNEGNLKTNIPNKRPSSPDKSNSNKGLFGMIFGNKKDTRVNQQILTFMGGRAGVGNSQVSFNIALNLAESGYRVIYIDLNDRFSTIEYVLQLGYADVGVNTALSAFEESNYNLISTSISNTAKILSTTDSDNFLYKTYSKIPNTLDFMFFSQQYMERVNVNGVVMPENIKIINPSLLKDLNMYLLMTGGYDFVILDVPADIHNELTEYALIYSNKIFFTITQDVSVIGHHLNDINIMKKKGINFIEKFYYLLNKNENASMNLKDVYGLLSDSLRLDNFNIVPIPNISKEIINCNYAGMPLLWNVKSKEFKNAFSEINKVIVQ